jgi:hypothetical protein
MEKKKKKKVKFCIYIKPVYKIKYQYDLAQLRRGGVSFG